MNGTRRAAVIGVVKHDGVIGQTLVVQLLEQSADFLIHQCHVVVVDGPVSAHNRRIGVIWGKFYILGRDARLGRQDALLAAITDRPLGKLSLMAQGRIEDSEERLARLAIVVMGFPAAFVPGLASFARIVVVHLRIVRTVIA